MGQASADVVFAAEGSTEATEADVLKANGAAVLVALSQSGATQTNDRRWLCRNSVFVRDGRNVTGWAN